MTPEQKLIDSLENGILIIDKQFKILFWNKWLAIHTGISGEKAKGKTLDDLFPETSFKLLKRKIKIALTIKSSTFINSSIDRYVIPIDLNKITKSIFRHMRQDVVITPLSADEVGVVIYDASALLEAKTIISEQLLLVEKQATTDTLTGCYNRKMFNDLLSAEIKKANRHEHHFALIIFDIDNFKSVNDTYGHLVGDQVLKEMADVCRNAIRQSDMFARWGGEEFSVLLPDTEIEGAAVLADKIRETIAAHHFGKPGHKTCSFGVACYSPDHPDDRLIINADNALYHAKNNGKNQVSVFILGTIVSFKDGRIYLK